MSIWLSVILCALLGYLLGCINPAYLIARARGFDIRSRGSGNAGASNAVITMGKAAGVFSAIIDIFKAWLAVCLATRYFTALSVGGIPVAGEIAGVACMLGHMFPFYLKFKGGKGFASYLGMILAINWKVALCILAAVVILTVLTDYIVVGTVTSVVSFPIYTAIRSGWLPLVILCVATLAILIKHRENFVRIWNGTEMGLSSAGRGKYKMK